MSPVGGLCDQDRAPNGGRVAARASMMIAEAAPDPNAARPARDRHDGEGGKRSGHRLLV